MEFGIWVAGGMAEVAVMILFMPFVVGAIDGLAVEFFAGTLWLAIKLGFAPIITRNSWQFKGFFLYKLITKIGKVSIK